MLLTDCKGADIEKLVEPAGLDPGGHLKLGTGG